MNLTIDPSWIIAIGLVSLRLAVVMYATPLDLFGRVPALIKVLWSTAFACFMVSFLDIEQVKEITSMDALVFAGLREVAIGLLLAFGLYTAFGAFSLAGRLLDFQAGFGAANLFNPATNEQNPLLGTVLVMLATFLFFAADFHLVMTQGFALSLQAMPLGATGLGVSAPAIIAQFGVMFTMGIMIAAPIIGILMMVDGGVAIMSKTMPQMNVYFLFLPLKSFLGLLMLGLLLPYMRPLIMNVMEASFQFWAGMM